MSTELLKRTSSETFAPIELATENACVSRYNECLAAWATGKFNIPEEVDATVAEFFTTDLFYDIKSAAGHTGLDVCSKVYGFHDVKDVFAFGAQFDYESLKMSVVAGPAPNEVWHLVEADQARHKETGKSAPLSRLVIATFEGDKMCKVVTAMHDPGSMAAVCSTENVPMPAVAELPAFEPHPDPLSIWVPFIEQWGSGDFSNPEEKEAAYAKTYAPYVVIDATNSAAPEVFKVYKGLEGAEAWVDGMWAQTVELSNVDLKPAAVIKPGCVVQKVTCDAKHKATGKEATGGEFYIESAINTAGKVVYQRFYYVNPEKIRDIF